MAELDWKREFEELGAAAVRARLIARNWSDQKRSAAREWLERRDAKSWQSTRAGSAGEPNEAKSGFEVFRRYKWVYYVIGGGFGLLALSQMFHY